MNELVMVASITMGAVAVGAIASTLLAIALGKIKV